MRKWWHEPADRDRQANDEGRSTGALRALVLVTTVNYLWQVPYYLHFYGSHGRTPRGLWVPLVVTGCWFATGAAMYTRRTRGGTAVLGSFLLVELLFYVVHNATGAAGRDLLSGDAVLTIASVLGYAATFAAAAFLVRMRRRARPRQGTARG